MDLYFLLGSIALLLIFLVVGFLFGFFRGLKRSSLHFLFFVVGIVVAYFITKPIGNAILNAKVTYAGESVTISDLIITLISQVFDLSAYESATAFLQKLPLAIICPLLFIVVTLVVYGVVNNIYRIVARLCFGKRKKEKHNRHRWTGAAIGTVEGFIFLYILFAPLTSLTGTFSSLMEEIQVEASTQAEQVVVLEDSDFFTSFSVVATDEQTEEENQQSTSNALPYLNELISNNVNSTILDVISAYNNSMLGSLCGAGGLDDALFDGLSNFSIDGEKINLRTEILTFAQTYNQFATVYNTFVSGDYSNIDLSELKTCVETFLDNGLFRSVVSDTVKTFVLEYDASTSSLNIPQELKDAITDLQIVFSAEDFDAAQYLKTDIMKIFDIADEILESGIIEDYNIISSSGVDIEGIFQLISDNGQSVKNISSSVFDLQIVNDTYSSLWAYICSLASDLLGENELISLDFEISSTSDIQNEICALVDVASTLSGGSVGEENSSYIGYLLSDGYDINTLISAMQNTTAEGSTDNDLVTALEQVFSSKIFRAFSLQVFQQVDSTIGEITTITPTTFENTDELSVLEDETVRQNTVSAIDELLTLSQEIDTEDLDIATIGKILDVLKVNAYNSGSKDGVFVAIFENLIWYMTGDDISADGIYTWQEGDENAKTPYMDGDTETYEQIKAYLAASDVEEYYQIDYTQKFAELATVVTFAQKLADAGIDTTLTIDETATVEEVVSSISTILEEIELTEEEIVTMIDNTATLLENLGEELSSQIQNYEDEIAKAIADTFGKDSDITNSLLALFGISTTATEE